MRKLNPVFILILLVFGVNLSFAQNSQVEQTEKITGTVIAKYSMDSLLCVYHPCSLRLIVRLDQGPDEQPILARITVEYFPNDRLPDRGFPAELVAKAIRWKFTAARSVNRDTAIEKYIKSVDTDGKDVTQEIATPAWILLPGAENEKIPIGDVLPSYFVKTGDYKKLKKQ